MCIYIYIYIYMSSLIMSSSLFPSVDLRTLNIICNIKSFFEKSFHDQQMAASGCFYCVTRVQGHFYETLGKLNLKYFMNPRPTD